MPVRSAECLYAPVPIRSVLCMSLYVLEYILYACMRFRLLGLTIRCIDLIVAITIRFWIALLGPLLGLVEQIVVFDLIAA